MFEYLSQYSPKELIGLVSVVGGILFLIFVVVSAQWASIRRAELKADLAAQELAFKQQMVDRGMSADEITRVLASGKGNDKATRHKEDSVDELVKV